MPHIKASFPRKTTPTLLRIELGIRQNSAVGIASLAQCADLTRPDFRVDEPQVVDEWRDKWRRLHSRFPWLVATTDDQLVGLTYASAWNDRTAYQWTVRPPSMSMPRGSAAGWARPCKPSYSAVCAAKSSAVSSRGSHWPNHPSVRLHERHGFIQVGQLVDAGFKRGGWHNVGFSRSAHCAPAATRYRRQAMRATVTSAQAPRWFSSS